MVSRELVAWIALLGLTACGASAPRAARETQPEAARSAASATPQAPAPVARKSAYEVEWADRCGPELRAPARPERYLGLLDYTAEPKNTIALLVVRRGGKRLKTWIEGPPDALRAKLEPVWRASAPAALECFGTAREAVVGLGVENGVVTDPAPKAAPEVQCLYEALHASLAGIALDGAEVLGVVYGPSAERSRRLGSKVARGSLTREQVQNGIDAGSGRIRQCFVDAVAVWPRIAGRIEVKFIIAPDGIVDAAAIAGSDVGGRPRESRALECCVVTRAGELAFERPRDDGHVIVTYPFVLAP